MSEGTPLRTQVINTVSGMNVGDRRTFEANGANFKKFSSSVHGCVSHYYRNGVIGKCRCESNFHKGTVTVWKMEE